MFLSNASDFLRIVSSIYQILVQDGDDGDDGDGGTNAPDQQHSTAQSWTIASQPYFRRSWATTAPSALATAARSSFGKLRAANMIQLAITSQEDRLHQHVFVSLIFLTLG